MVDKKEGEVKPAENVRGVKGPDTRQMKDHPVYLKAYLGKRAVDFLVDMGCERSVTLKRLTGDAILEPAECRLFAANGTVINVLGEVTINIRIGDLILPTCFVVSDNITEPIDSPDREHCGPSRQPFPGAVSRGAGGCRVYVPTSMIVANEGTTDPATERKNPSVIASVFVETSSGTSVPVDETTGGRPLVLSTRSINVPNTGGGCGSHG